MVQRQGGFRRGTRSSMKKEVRRKGKISIRNFLRKIEKGTQVQLVAEPAYQKGMFLPRFQGKIGTVEGQQGECYLVRLKDHNKEKTLLVHPVHLKVR